MLIHFERFGGFMGRRMATTIDTSSLSPEEAQEWQELVTAANFFELPDHLAAPTRGADRFYYKLSIENELQQHTVEASESALPPDLEPLLQRLSAQMRRPSNM